MFNRKVLLMAVLAVVLLVTLMDGTVSADGRSRRKPRRVETNTNQAVLTNRMKPVAGITAANANPDQAIAAGRKGGHKRRVSLDAGGSNQTAVVIGAADPNNGQASLIVRHRRRKLTGTI